MGTQARTTPSSRERREEPTLDRRKRASRSLIFGAAANLAESGELDGTTMKDLAKAAGVTVNTIKNQPFSNVSDVAVTLLDEAGSFGMSLSKNAIDNLSRVAEHSRAQSDRERINEIHRMLTDIVDRSKRGLRTSNVVLEELEALHTEVDKTYPDELPLLAEISYSIAAIYLRPDDELDADPSNDRRSEALLWAKRGITRLESDRRTRQFDLGQRLTALAAEAARQLISLHTAAITAKSSELERATVQVKVMAQLAIIVANKEKERGYALKLNRPLRAAAAEFHRARAEAMMQGFPQGEIDAVLQMARELDTHSDTGPVPEDILEVFLVRTCAVQVAYRDLVKADEHSELKEIRRRLIDTLPSSAKQRAASTLFDLADHDPTIGKPVRVHHVTDLMLVSTYGVVGRVLLADHLKAIADSFDADGNPPEMYRGTDELKISEAEYRAAARYWYTQAPSGMNVLGVAATLAERARQALADGTWDGVRDTAPWAILDQETNGLNTLLLDQLSLGAVTGRAPTKEQAQRLLDELHPLLTVLKSISEGRTGPVENLS